MIGWRWHVAAIVAAISMTFPSAIQPAAAADDRFVTADIECTQDLSSETGLPRIEVTIENQSGSALFISYLHSFGTAPNLEAGITGLSLAAPRDEAEIELPDGETASYTPSWEGGVLKRSDVIVALIVSSGGVFLPRCGADEPVRATYGGESDAEAAKIGELTIGQLESWRAYPALYTLMHPDARELISYEQIACWYAERYGPPVTSKTNTIFDTTVNEIRFVDWTWKVTGENFEVSAEVDYAQTTGLTEEKAESTAGTVHLVKANGLWRWFFGSSIEGINKLSGNCELPETL